MFRFFKVFSVLSPARKPAYGVIYPWFGTWTRWTRFTEQLHSARHRHAADVAGGGGLKSGKPFPIGFLPAADDISRWLSAGQAR